MSSAVTSPPSTKRRRVGAYLVLCAATAVFFLSLWRHLAIPGPMLRGIATFGLLVALSLAYGRLFARATGVARAGNSSIPLEFLGGYLVLNTMLFLLILASPLGMAANLMIVGAGGFAAAFAGRRTWTSDECAPAPASLLAFVLCGVAATLWCTDSLAPLVREGSTIIFQLWGDSFVHARLISILAHAHGLASMSDLRMSGAPAYLYHYAAYAVPAALSAMTRGGALETFASFFLPFGVFLTGLAAFAFAGGLWGRWPAVAAAAAILLVPDAYEQGFGNKYLSYNFMQQVNAAGLYGVACMAIAWLFMLRGCRERHLFSIVIGWAIAIVALSYKAQVFVANAFLIMVYPCLFFPRLALRWRFASAAALIACFALVVMWSQAIDRVPTLRLDGSGARAYVAYLLANQDQGLVKSLLEHGLGDQPWSAWRLVTCGSTLILLGTFGWWSAAAIATVVWVRKRVPAALSAFPLLVMANYLVMALGLAMDSKAIGSPDELLNRPLVWAYFAVAAWTGAVAYWRLFGAELPRGAMRRALLGSAGLLGLLVPLSFGRSLQTFPHWQGLATFREASAAPACLVDAARFIRKHSDPGDVVQDSEDDRRIWVTGLAERQDFAMAASVNAPAGLAERLADLAALKRMTRAEDVREYARRNRIAWYLLEPASEVAWPPELLAEAVFECGGFRVFHFAQ